jgi:hypothetical protein
MMTKHESLAFMQVLNKDGIACFTCRRFQADTARTIDFGALHIAVHTQQRTQSHAVRRPLGAFRIQSMIDMQRAQAACSRFGQMRQRVQ